MKERGDGDRTHSKREGKMEKETGRWRHTQRKERRRDEIKQRQ